MNTIIEKILPKERFIKEFEELGFELVDWGWSGEDDECNATQDYSFDFPYANITREEEEENCRDGLIKLIIDKEEEAWSIDMRVKQGKISELKRKELSEIIHKIKEKLEEKYEKVTLHGILIKNFDFYERTINESNKEELGKIAKEIIYEKEKNNLFNDSFLLRGKEGEIFADFLIKNYGAEEEVTYLEMLQYEKTISFDKKKISVLSGLKLSEYFATIY